MDGQSNRDSAVTANRSQNNSITEVAVTGSPNTVMDVHFDVRSMHLHRSLLGSLLALSVPIIGQQEAEELLVLGQVAAIKMQNRWHEELAL